ncbi:MAG: insulinase family protein [Rhodobacteraceae bacterium]|jgi:zinc protease|nr:insulinase family protein [Paracoccaceae bacterium]
MFRALVLGLSLSLAALSARAAEITDFTLPNGLQVVVIEDSRAPVVVHMLWYRVGAADEAPGESGLAHFLEHLMFKGTETLAPGEFSTTVAANGGSDNAFTSWDYTAYFQRVASDRLGLMMQMEADRMKNLRLTQEDVDTERDVVIEERNQRTDSNPGARFAEQRRAVQFLNHPYRRPIIGWRHEIDALSMDAALAFYEKYYAPNNAVLVVAGDVTADQVRTLAEEHYGPLVPSDRIAPRVRPVEPPQIAPRRVSYADARVAQPYVVRTYLAPQRRPGDQSQAAALTLLAELLGGESATSVLGRKLQFDTGEAIWAGAFYDGTSLDATTFGLTVVPAEGVSLEQAEAAMDRVLAEFLVEGIDDAAFERLKFQVRAAQVYALDDMQGLARRYGEGLTTGLTVADIEAWPDVLQAVTKDQVMEAARAVLNMDASVTGWLMTEDAPTGVGQ